MSKRKQIPPFPFGPKEMPKNNSENVMSSGLMGFLREPPFERGGFLGLFKQSICMTTFQIHEGLKVSLVDLFSVLRGGWGKKVEI